mgnify:FL=1
MGRKKKDNDEEVEKIKTPKAIGPYDIISMMFTNFEGFNKLSNTILDKNFFMINRVFSIKYPLQGALFNKLNINTAGVIKSWAMFISNKEGYGRVPYFVYTKGAKKSADSTSKTDKLDKELIKEYCKRYKINLKDFDMLNSLYHDELINDVKRYEKLISIKEQEKNITKK